MGPTPQPATPLVGGVAACGVGGWGEGTIRVVSILVSVSSTVRVYNRFYAVPTTHKQAQATQHGYSEVSLVRLASPLIVPETCNNTVSPTPTACTRTCCQFEARLLFGPDTTPLGGPYKENFLVQIVLITSVL